MIWSQRMRNSSNIFKFKTQLCLDKQKIILKQLIMNALKTKARMKNYRRNYRWSKGTLAQTDTFGIIQAMPTNAL